MTYEETLGVIKKLKCLDLENVSDSVVKRLLRLIIYIPLPILYVNVGVKIIRCRTISICKDEFVQERIYCTYAEFSNPKRKKFYSMGRANTKDFSIFYGGITSEFMRGFDAACFELVPTTPHEHDGMKDLDFKTLDLIAGIWVVQKPLPVVMLGSLSHNYINLNKLGHQRVEMMEDFLENNPKNSDIVRLVDEFLGAEFSKDVKKGEEYNYRISANYVDLLQEIKMVKGIIYPSIKSAGAGINIGIFSKNVRNKYIKLVHGVHSIFHNRDNDCANEYSMKGDYLDGKIRWKEHFEEKKTPLIMRNYYLGLSDDDSFKKHISIIDLSKPVQNTNI